MPLIGIALAYLGYGIFIQGYMWFRGYNVTPADVWSPTRYYTGPWPPEASGGIVGHASGGVLGGGSGIAGTPGGVGGTAGGGIVGRAGGGVVGT